MRRAWIRKWVVRPFLVLLLAALGFLGWNLATANFATVEAGRIYRSGQMRAGSTGSGHPLTRGSRPC